MLRPALCAGHGTSVARAREGGAWRGGDSVAMRVQTLDFVATRTPVMLYSVHMTSRACFMKVQFFAKDDHPTQS